MVTKLFGAFNRFPRSRQVGRVVEGARLKQHPEAFWSTVVGVGSNPTPDMFSLIDCMGNLLKLVPLFSPPQRDEAKAGRYG